MFNVVYEQGFYKDLKTLDRQQARLILTWIKKNLDHANDPKSKGKALTGNLKGYWRYRIGNYRLITEIKDNELILICIAIGHRKNIYD